MDATLGVGFALDRSQMMPETTDEFAYTWGERVIQQQIRAMGLRGSYVTDLPTLMYPGETYTFETSLIRLPVAYFGTSQPPIVVGYPQYGTAVYMDNFADANRAFAWDNFGDDANVPPAMLTWAEITIRTDVLLSTHWAFRIKHQIKMPDTRNPGGIGGVVRYRAPYYQMKFREFPWNIQLAGMLPTSSAGTKLALHWVVPGLDPSF